jgi:hypothetical protein
LIQMVPGLLPATTDLGKKANRGSSRHPRASHPRRMRDPPAAGG